MCLTWPRANQPTPDGIDWQLGVFPTALDVTCTYSSFSGSAFLRSVYTVYRQVFDLSWRTIRSDRRFLAMASMPWKLPSLDSILLIIKPSYNRTPPLSLHFSPSTPQPSLRHFPIPYSRRHPTQHPLTLSILPSRLKRGKLCCPSSEQAPTRR